MSAPLAPLLTPEQAAAVLGLGTDELASMRRAGTGPRFCRFGPRTVRYSPAALSSWQLERRFEDHRKPVEPGFDRASRTGHSHREKEI